MILYCFSINTCINVAIAKCRVSCEKHFSSFLHFVTYHSYLLLPWVIGTA